MRINEVAQAPEVDITRLVALAQFLLGRAQDTGADPRISLKTFLHQARGLGIGITRENLQNLAMSGPLKNIVANVTPDEVIFRTDDDVQPDGITGEPSADQSQNIVAGMAQRALK